MKVIAVTKKGTEKRENEDRIIVGKSVIADGVLESAAPCGVVAVADGVGGHNAGAVASHFVATRLSELSSPTVEDLEKINDSLLALSSEHSEYEGMATTLSGFVTDNGTVNVFSVGNTRVYLLQSGKYLKQLTTDDTLLNYLIATGHISAQEADSFDRKNEITACFGCRRGLFKMKYSTLDSTPSAFILTTDGIHDYISVDLMEDIIAENGFTVKACEEMITMARKAGSADDASIVAVEI